MIKQKIRYIWREWILGALIPAAFLAFCVIRPFIVEAYRIPTGSMIPTLLPNDIILVNKFIYGARVPFTGLRLPGFKSPNRGEVMVFIYPEDRKKNFIKRLIGLPGETVEIKNGTVYINEQPLTDPIFNQRYYYNRGSLGAEGQKITIPKNSYFVMGDNSGSSMDSRYWGFVPKKDVLGQAMVIFWPPNRIRIIK